MRFLVTGGAGFIGSHLVERLLKEGNFVRVLDNFSSGKKENLSFASKLQNANFDLIQGDIRNKETCDKSCKDIDYILHQAALRSVPRSIKEPESYNDVNIGGTLNILQAAVKNNVKRLVFASSSSVYGDARRFPEKESDFPLLISPYALTKLAGEYYCRIFSQIYGLETVCLRYFNVFGPRQALDDEYAVVIPKFIHSIIHDEKPPVFGTGRQSRDFTYVDNVVEANILAATGKRKKGVEAHEVFNVANGKDNTVLALVSLLNKLTGKNISPKILPKRPGDVYRTLADITKIKRKLGFKPMIGFKKGIKNTLDYFKSNPPKR